MKLCKFGQYQSTGLEESAWKPYFVILKCGIDLENYDHSVMIHVKEIGPVSFIKKVC